MSGSSLIPTAIVNFFKGISTKLSGFNNNLIRHQKAFNESLNDFTTPKYLFKAGIMSDLEGNKKAALAYFKRIQEEFPESQEGKQIKIQIGRLEN